MPKLRLTDEQIAAREDYWLQAMEFLSTADAPHDQHHEQRKRAIQMIDEMRNTWMLEQNTNAWIV